MWLLSLVALSGMAISAGPSLQLTTALLTILGGILAIGASGTFNQIFEVDIDQNMDRTANRPLATQRIPILNAWIFGISLAMASLFVFFPDPVSRFLVIGEWPPTAACLTSANTVFLLPAEF